jgi:hypothetical protein
MTGRRGPGTNGPEQGKSMEITVRDAVTVMHGMGFGAVLLLSFSGAFFAIYSSSVAGHPWTKRDRALAGYYLIGMALLAWVAVIVGAYVVYPWYRATPPAGTIDLTGYPKRLLTASASTSGWHDIGMEWKEHFAWFAPIALTAVAYVFIRYGDRLASFRGLRNAVIALLALAFAATSVAGFFGAMLNKYAPVRGGPEITIMKGEGHD